MLIPGATPIHRATTRGKITDMSTTQPGKLMLLLATRKVLSMGTEDQGLITNENSSEISLRLN